MASKKLEALRAHNDMFRKDVIKVVPAVYTSVGFGASVSTMIVGDAGVIIIDTTDSTKAAENTLKEFRKITDKPVQAIIYTHGHRDHVSGATVFAEGGSPEIYARHNLANELATAEGPYKILQQRTMRQFGIKWLEPFTERVNIGLGPADKPEEGLGQGFMPPTKQFSGEKEVITVEGVTLEMVAAPGETDDALVVWMPEDKLLFGGDNFYQAFPNLYAIRGTKYRDFNVWADSLDFMANMNADYLIPGHTRPITGAEAVKKALSSYRDAIRYIIEKTAEGMNKGLYLDELAEYVKLPEELASEYALQEFYGTVAWSAKSYACGELGWFDGNPTSLFPTPPKEKAARIAKLAGGADALAKKMHQATENGEHQWAMELADIINTLDEGHLDAARSVKIAVLRALADDQINACARNYYLVYSKQLEAGVVSR
ncbi:alkyl sulfatase dimerization domain-containing protein [Thermodesulfobacteriota bacterium]